VWRGGGYCAHASMRPAHTQTHTGTRAHTRDSCRTCSMRERGNNKAYVHPRGRSTSAIVGSVTGSALEDPGPKTLCVMPMRVGILPVMRDMRDGVQILSAAYLHAWEVMKERGRGGGAWVCGWLVRLVGHERSTSRVWSGCTQFITFPPHSVELACMPG
jgi:hypothetical protein